MALSESKERKVKISLMNWVAGGSLLSVPRATGGGRRRAMKNFNATVTDKDNTKNQGKKYECKELGNSGVSNITSTTGRVWTEDQDSKLREMKKANKSWKEITAVMGAGRKDLVARYYELTQAESGTAKENQLNGNSRVEEHKQEGGGLGDFTGLFDDPVGAGENTKQNLGGLSGGGVTKPKTKDKQKSKEKGLSQLPRGEEQNTEECDCLDCTRGRQASQAQQSTIYGYGGRINVGSRGGGGLQPDNIWTEEDCRILEELEKRYKENKWMEIQAGFFNWTGRMVVAEIIEKKFKGDGVA